MKVLITGATGFVGGWLVKKLVDLGLEVRVIQRRTTQEDLWPSGVEVFSGDITLPETLDAAARDVHSIFHLAGYIGYSRAARPLMDHVNIKGTENIVEACIKNHVTRLVHMSSVVAVGASFDGTPLNEESPYNLEHLNLGYFETKRQAELIVKNAVKNGLIDAVILNPSTIYGPGDAQKGSRSTQLKVARKKFPFYTSGGVSIVDIDDVTAALVNAWKIGRPGERYILSGENISIKSLFEMIATAAGVEPPKIYLPNPIVHGLGKVGDLLEKIGQKGPINSENAWTSTLYHWFDHSKATKELGFFPKPAQYSIARSVNWMKEHGLLNNGAI